MIMSSSTGSGEEHTCKGGSWASCFIKGRFQLFLLEKNSFENGKQHKLIIIVESAIIKKSLLIHWLLTAGRWGLNKHSQHHVNFGEDAPCFPSCRGAVPPGPPWAPQATFQLATSGRSSPCPPPPAGPPPGDNALLRGLGCLEYPPACFVPLPFSASFSPFCPLPTSPFSLTEYFPIQKPFASAGPLVLPSRLAEPAVPAEASPLGD